MRQRPTEYRPPTSTSTAARRPAFTRRTISPVHPACRGDSPTARPPRDPLPVTVPVSPAFALLQALGPTAVGPLRPSSSHASCLLRPSDSPDGADRPVLNPQVTEPTGPISVRGPRTPGSHQHDDPAGHLRALSGVYQAGGDVLSPSEFRAPSRSKIIWSRLEKTCKRRSDE